MQLTPIASNMTEVETSEARILFSYRTPVAAYVFGKDGFGGGFVRTEKWWSVTTSRHINKWWPENGTVKEVTQTYLDNLVQEVIIIMLPLNTLAILYIICFICLL